MKPLSFFLLVTSFTVAACGAPATVATVPAPAPARAPAVSAPAPVVAAPSRAAAVSMAEAPRNWQLLDESIDHVPGISSERAMRELVADKTPKRTVLVAIIDNGIDTAHVDLKANLWTNPKEVAGNGKDDDHNGFVDDIHGWNFIGGHDGQDVHFDTFEITRQYAACHDKPAASGQPKITDAAKCSEIDKDFETQRDKIQGEFQTYQQIHTVMQQIIPLLKRAAMTDSLTAARVRALAPSSPQITQARQIFLELDAQGATPAAIDDGFTSLEGQVKYSLNPDL